jgi:G:T-mismatch repair DNA endonuclease (very short patch repair protein)
MKPPSDHRSEKAFDRFRLIAFNPYSHPEGMRLTSKVRGRPDVILDSLEFSRVDGCFWWI